MAILLLYKKKNKKKVASNFINKVKGIADVKYLDMLYSEKHFLILK